VDGDGARLAHGIGLALGQVDGMAKEAFRPEQAVAGVDVGIIERLGIKLAGEFDLVVLDATATPAMALKMEVVKTLPEELFLLQTMGDDRAIAETYVAGVALKAGLR
jgi:hypothetical protein